MCNLSWTPHSNLEKDNSLKTTRDTPVLAQRWAVWSILTKSELRMIATSVQMYHRHGDRQTDKTDRLRQNSNLVSSPSHYAILVI